ncbi:MAG: hypothetical protein KC503_22765, partial [Myxococcales bacterium]|nr:hypothetical protein [Myxococcales bacterium]
MRPLCTVLLLLLHAAPAAARFTPVLREDVAKLVKRRARVYVARDCRMDKIWYMPGDSFVATHRISVGGRYYDRGKIGCKGAGSKCEIGIWCLSKTPVDYS